MARQTLKSKNKQPLTSKKVIQKIEQQIIKKKCLRQLTKKRLQQKYSIDRISFKSKMDKFQALELCKLADNQTLMCPICLQLILQPVLTECGHTYCLTCAQNLSRHQYSCGLCRGGEAIQQYQPSKLLSALVSQYVRLISQQQQNSFELRREAMLKEQQKRKIGDVQVGDYIDFCNHKNVWKEGVIKKITKISCSQIILTVESSDLDEAQFNIKSTSRKLASHNYYTKKKQLVASIVPNQSPSFNSFFDPTSLFFGSYFNDRFSAMYGMRVSLNASRGNVRNFIFLD